MFDRMLMVVGAGVVTVGVSAAVLAGAGVAFAATEPGAGGETSTSESSGPGNSQIEREKAEVETDTEAQDEDEDEEQGTATAYVMPGPPERLTLIDEAFQFFANIAFGLDFATCVAPSAGPAVGQPGDLIEMSTPNTALSLDGKTKPGQSIGQHVCTGSGRQPAPHRSRMRMLRIMPSCGTVGRCAGCILPTSPAYDIVDYC